MSTIEVVLPSLGSPDLDRLLRSLSLGSRQPDGVVIVSNEIDDLETYGLPVRIVSFDSQYPYGHEDVALRCNIAAYAAQADFIVYQGEDHIASPGMLAASLRLLEMRPYFFGHHRKTSFDDKTVEQVMGMPPEAGDSREHGVNRFHGYWSCYSGMFGIRREFMYTMGGFDMAFTCRHGGEDQQFGRRLSRRVHQSEQTFIFEPPFSWHPTDPHPWGTPRRRNVCPDGEHKFVEQGSFRTCRRCPFSRYIGDEKTLFDRWIPLVPFEPSKVRWHARGL